MLRDQLSKQSKLYADLQTRKKKNNVCGRMDWDAEQQGLFLQSKYTTACSYFCSARRYGYIYWKNLCVCLLIECISNNCARSIQTDAWRHLFQWATADDRIEREKGEEFLVSLLYWWLNQITSLLYLAGVGKVIDHVFEQFAHTDGHSWQCVLTWLLSLGFCPWCPESGEWKTRTKIL